MPDNSDRIAEIRELLQSGLTSTNIDGTTEQMDLASLRTELRQLMAEDNTQRIRKPRLSSVDLSRLRRG
jgi:hypothetical protein